MKIRYRCTSKPWHLTHPIETDEKLEEIENPIRCMFCGADMHPVIVE